MADAYTRAVLRARRLHLALDERTKLELLRLMERHADALARAVTNLPEDAPAQQIARMVRDLYDRLERRLVGVTESGVRGQAVAIKTTMDEAAFDAIRSAGWRGSFVPTPAVTVAQAFLAREGTAASFRTLRYDARQAAAGVDDIISAALLEQMSPEELSRRLRPYVLGSESFTAEELQDLRRVPKARRDAARQLRYNADRIAITEMGNAAHEAQTVAMIEAPQVKGWRWRLSPVRGTQTTPDECNVLADQDLYGLGPGVYPVDRVPTRPHPRCRCNAPWTKVLTARGWVRIDTIGRGDLVWTHGARWREVLAPVVGEVTGGWMRLGVGGRTLTLTTDHPVLTARGSWVDAGALRCGERVVALGHAVGDVRAEEVGVRAQLIAAALPVENQEFPSVRGAQRGLLGVFDPLLSRAVPSAVDLHGEHHGGDRYVDVRALQRPQPFGWDATFTEPIQHGPLVLRQALVGVNGAGSLSSSSDGLGRPRENLPAMHAESFPLFWGRSFVPDVIGLRHRPWDHPHALQPGADGRPRDAEASRNFQFGEPFGYVQPPDFVEVEVEWHSRISSRIRRYCLVVADDSSFVAEGLVVHNCWGQSVTRPMSEWGRAKPSPGLQNRPSAEGLAGLSPAAQKRAVAEARQAITNGINADRQRRSERRRVA